MSYDAADWKSMNLIRISGLNFSHIPKIGGKIDFPKNEKSTRPNTKPGSIFCKKNLKFWIGMAYLFSIFRKWVAKINFPKKTKSPPDIIPIPDQYFVERIWNFESGARWHTYSEFSENGLQKSIFQEKEKSTRPNANPGSIFFLRIWIGS